MKKNNVLKKLLYILFLIPFFEPRCMPVFFPKISYILYTLLPCPVLLIFALFTIKRKCFTKIIVYILLFMSILLFSTIINNGDLKEILKISFEVIGLTLLINYGLTNDAKNFLDCSNIFFTLLVFINLTTIILYPNGMYIDSSNYTENWFFGYRNIHILFILPAIIFNFSRSYYLNYNLNKYNYIYLITCLVSMILSKSGTSIIGLFLIVALLSLYRAKRTFSIKRYANISLTAFVSIVILRIQEIFKFIIVDIMKKDLTFTGRTYIWNDVEGLILKKPLFGYGQEFKNIRLIKTRIPSYHAHNQFLEIAYKTGAVGMLIFLIIISLCVKKLNNFKEYSIAKFFSICLFAVLIMMITEAYVANNILYLFVIFYNVDNLIKVRGEKNEENIKKSNVTDAKRHGT